MSEWVKDFIKRLEIFAETVTPDVARELANCYTEIMVNGKKEKIHDFYKVLRKHMNLPEYLATKLLEDSKNGRAGTEVSIMAKLEYITKDDEARSLIKKTNINVYNATHQLKTL